MDSRDGYRGVQTKICDRSLTQEINEDFSLPDYQPEIRRLLKVDVALPPLAKYIGAGKAEFSGDVIYNILYIGSDNGLYSCRLSTEYSFDTQLDNDKNCDMSENIVCFAKASPDSVVSRVTAPRKLNIRCRLKAKVCAAAIRTISEQTSGLFEPANLERLTDSADTAFFCHGVSEPLSVGDDIIPESHSTGDRLLRVISSEGTVFITETNAVQGAVNCRGDLNLKIMYCYENSDGSAPAQSGSSALTLPQIMQRKIPINVSVELDGAMPGDDCRAWGYCPEISVIVEDGRFLCSGEIVAEAETQRNGKVPFTRDMYATDRECLCSYTDCEMPIALRCTNGNFTQSGSVQLSDISVAPGSSIIDISGSASADKVEFDHGKYIITGNCRYTCLLCDGEELFTKDFELPMRYEVDGDNNSEGKSGDDGFEVNVDVFPVSCRARIDGERIGVDTEMAVSMRICKDRKVTVLSQATFGEKTEKPRGVFRICYPSADDSLWSVAKRYQIKLKDLESANELTQNQFVKRNNSSSLDGIKFLVV